MPRYSYKFWTRTFCPVLRTLEFYFRLRVCRYFLFQPCLCFIFSVFKPLKSGDLYPTKMVREDKSTWKANYFTKIGELFDEYPKCFIVGVDNVGSKQMQEIRHAMRGKCFSFLFIDSLLVLFSIFVFDLSLIVKLQVMPSF